MCATAWRCFQVIPGDTCPANRPTVPLTIKLAPIPHSYVCRVFMYTAVSALLAELQHVAI